MTLIIIIVLLFIVLNYKAKTKKSVSEMTILNPEWLKNKSVLEVNNALDLGANINDTDTYGNTALMVSIVSNRSDITKFLLEQGADVNISEKKRPNSFNGCCRSQPSRYCRAPTFLWSKCKC